MVQSADIGPGNWNDFWNAQAKAGKGGLSWSKRRIISVLERNVLPDMAVLDAGCGSGFFSAWFIKRGCRAYALDYSAEALEMARKVTAGKAQGYMLSDLLDSNFGSNYKENFDVIFTDGLFEHFSEADQKKIIDNFIASLKPGGLIATFCPNRYSPWELIRPFYMPGIKETPFTNRGMDRLHAGLQIIEKDGVNVLPFGWSPEFMGRYFGMLLYRIARKNPE